MDHQLQQKLRSLPRLGSALRQTPKCKICGQDTKLFDIVDFNKWCSDRPYDFGEAGVQVKYFRCNNCRFIFTDFIDDWSASEIAEHIYNDDYILVDPGYREARPLDQAKEMAKLLDGCQGLHILDYGSGSGNFSKNMKEFGFASVASYDPFSSPIRPDGLFDLVTAFEVVEHSPNPVQTFAEMRDFTAADGAVLVGQTVQPANIEEIRGAWWYLAPRNGHVSTYGDFTFSVIAKKLGLLYRRHYHLGGIFAFTRGSLPAALATAMARIGPNFSVCILGAPDGEVRAFDPWDKLEPWHDGVRFRWTGRDNVVWDRCNLEAGVNRIEVPFVMEIAEGFARRCWLSVSGRELPTTVDGKSVVAEVSLPTRGVYTVSLRTPPPLSPRQMGRGPDPRSLGLAVAVQTFSVAS